MKHNTLNRASKSRKSQHHIWLEHLQVLSEKSPYEDLLSITGHTLTDRHEKSYQETSTSLSSDITEKLSHISQDNDMAIYCILSAAYACFIYHFSGEEHVAFSSPPETAVQLQADQPSEQIVPIFLNVTGSISFKELILQAKRAVLDAYQQQNYSFEEFLHEWKGQVSSDWFRYSMEYAPLHSNGATTNKDLDLKIVFAKYENSLQCTFCYRAEMFNPTVIDTLMKSFLHILGSAVAGINKNIQDMSLIHHNEEQEMLHMFDYTEAVYPNEYTVGQLIEEQCRRTPEHTAVIYGKRRMNYAELEQKASALAEYLHRSGVQKHDIVLVMQNRSLELIVSLLAIWKVGAVYMPVDPHIAPERLKYIISDSKVRHALSTDEWISRLPKLEMIIDVQDPSVYEYVSFTYPFSQEVTNQAYILYTSGSTGRPKGVIVEHQSVVSRLNWMMKEFQVTNQDIVLQKTPYTFDVSVWEFFLPLIAGSILCLLEPYGEKDPETVLKAISYYEITLLHFVPSMLHVFLEYIDGSDSVGALTSLRAVFASGEALLVQHVNRFNKLLYQPMNISLVNLYGPTEATIDVTSFVCSPFDQNHSFIPIGRPIDNVRLYIMNKHQRLLPTGFPGELCIGGIATARGYLNNQELTNHQFIINPYNKDEIIYRTGDLTCLMPDGNIRYIGRMDDQVKLNGNRIELKEIEAIMLQHNCIGEAAAFVISDSANINELVAYVTLSGGDTTSSEQIEIYLSKFLPSYMIPSRIRIVKRFPLTLNGKLDRNALINMERDAEGPQSVIAKTEDEVRMLEIWSQVLGSDRQIGFYDLFFKAGGSSLKAALLLTKVFKLFKVKVSFQDFVKNNSVATLLKLIEKRKTEDAQEIKKEIERPFYSVSSAQRRLYFLQEMDLNGTNYNMPEMLVISGPLNVRRLQEVFAELVQRHEAFRTSFVRLNDDIYQHVADSVDLCIPCGEIQRNNVEDLIAQLVLAFDLTQAPLIRTAIFSEAEDRHYLFIDMHHIISDGLSVEIMVREIMDLYHGKPIEEIRIQYKDYAAWHNKLLESEAMYDMENYWLETLGDQIPVLEMTTDYPRHSKSSSEGDVHYFEMDDCIKQKVQQLAEELNATPFIVLLAAYFVLLSKYSGQEDLVIAYPTAGRSHPDLEKIVGMFVNTVVMRAKPVGDLTFKQFVNEVRDHSHAILDNQDFPLERLVERLKINRDSSRNTLFDTMFAMKDASLEKLSLNDLSIERFEIKKRAIKFDFYLNVEETKERLQFELHYRTDLFRKRSMERLAESYHTIINRILESFEIKLSELSIISDKEANDVMQQINDTTVAYPNNTSLGTLFREQVIVSPDAEAIVEGSGKCISYSDLEHLSNQYAQWILQKVEQRVRLIPVLLEPGIDFVATVIAIIKTGSAYVPVDPRFPVERIRYLLEDCNAEFMITSKRLYSNLESQFPVLFIEDMEAVEDMYQPVADKHFEGQLAYVMYTSGSTGKPKGVMIEHRSIIRLVKAQDYIELCPGQQLLNTSSFTFDAATFDIWGSLLNGLTLHIVEKETILSGETLNTFLMEKKIDIMFLTSPLFTQLAEYMPSMFSGLKYLLVGGDVISPVSVNHVRQACPDMKFVHVYGPTENTTFTTAYLVQKDFADKIPIGRPIRNTTAYIMDPYGNLQPIGVPGEIYVGGEGIAQGYLNAPELTLTNFVYPKAIGYQKMYRTGDYGKWTEDGMIEFIGRADHLVKIRGFRVSVSEIESCLFGHPLIKEAVVVIVGDNEVETNRLAAYYVAEGSLEPGELNAYLARHLPEYMIPTFIMRLDKVPLTVNSKIDRRALPLVQTQLKKEYIPPTTEWEKKMAVIWGEVLELERVGVTDDFFELGGHSLKAGILANKVSNQMELKLPLVDFFSHSTIRKLGELLRFADFNDGSSIQPVSKKKFYPISSAQRGVYAVASSSNSIVYNIPDVKLINGVVDLVRIEEAYRKIIAKHEGLRTGFEQVDGNVVQVVHDDVTFSITILDNPQESINELIAAFIQPFDLSRPPLLRAQVIRKNESTYLLSDMHHIVADGSSMKTILNDFSLAYRGEDLSPISVHYKDFVEWQAEDFLSGTMKTQERYWLEQFKEEVKTLDLPFDYNDYKPNNYHGEDIIFSISPDMYGALKFLAQQQNVSMFMLLFSAFHLLLAKWTNNRDIVIGIPVAGRRHADLEDMVGMFVNTLAIRNTHEPKLPFLQFLAQVKHNILSALDNQDYQFETLLEKLELKRDHGRHPLFDVMFIYQNMSFGSDDSELGLSSVNFSHPVSKTAIELYGEEKAGTIEFTFRFQKKFFHRESISRLKERFCFILEQIMRKSEIEISDIQIVSPEEHSTLVYSFNDNNLIYDHEKLIHQLIEEQVERTPDAIAVRFRNQCITYRELNNKANILSGILRKRGVLPNQAVGVLLRRSSDIIVAILGILKAGGVFLPIDPSYPKERLQYILAHSGAKVTITSQDIDIDIELPPSVDTIFLNEMNQQMCSNPSFVNHSSDLAYIIYTSGSTGKPKGVMIEHRSLHNFFCGIAEVIPFTEQRSMLSATSMSFDIFHLETLLPLILGLTVILADEKQQRDASELTKLLLRETVDIVQFTPSRLSQLIQSEKGFESLQTVKHIVVGGEALSDNLWNKIKRLKETTTIFNVYGPTETTVWSTVSNLSKATKVTIGKPISNTRIYILDDELNILPIGSKGSLFIAGDGLARGYFHQEELTSERFVKDPFFSGQRMYNTGDLAKWNFNGELEFLGRLDHQVKVRGNRVELSEVEGCLLSHESINNVAVIMKKNNEEMTQLCAYFISKSEVSKNDLRSFMQKKLPSYMIPSIFIRVESMPLTPNGKLDLMALPEPKWSSLNDQNVEPRNEVERVLCEIWAKVLDVDQVGIQDNFFDMGGHSLMVAKVEVEMESVGIETEGIDIYQYPTIALIAEQLEKGSTIGGVRF